MTSEQFHNAVKTLQEAGIIAPGHGWRLDLARKLGVSRQTVANFEKEGTRQIQTDYAIAALINGLEPWPTSLDSR